MSVASERVMQFVRHEWPQSAFVPRATYAQFTVFYGLEALSLSDEEVGSMVECALGNLEYASVLEAAICDYFGRRRSLGRLQIDVPELLDALAPESRRSVALSTFSWIGWASSFSQFGRLGNEKDQASWVARRGEVSAEVMDRLLSWGGEWGPRHMIAPVSERSFGPRENLLVHLSSDAMDRLIDHSPEVASELSGFSEAQLHRLLDLLEPSEELATRLSTQCAGSQSVALRILAMLCEHADSELGTSGLTAMGRALAQASSERRMALLDFAPGELLVAYTFGYIEGFSPRLEELPEVLELLDERFENWTKRQSWPAAGLDDALRKELVWLVPGLAVQVCVRQGDESIADELEVGNIALAPLYDYVCERIEQTGVDLATGLTLLYDAGVRGGEHISLASLCQTLSALGRSRRQA